MQTRAAHEQRRKFGQDQAGRAPDLLAGDGEVRDAEIAGRGARSGACRGRPGRSSCGQRQLDDRGDLVRIGLKRERLLADGDDRRDLKAADEDIDGRELADDLQFAGGSAELLFELAQGRLRGGFVRSRSGRRAG